MAAGLLAPLALLGGFAPLTLPLGPPWSPASLALDPLSAWFLLILSLATVPACLFAAQSPLSRAQALALALPPLRSRRSLRLPLPLLPPPPMLSRLLTW